MQGAGNDYVFVDEREKSVVENPAKSAVFVSNRRFSVGSDGLVLIQRSDVADCRMRIFNADGTEGAACGNALRCVGKYLADKSCRGSFAVETKGGVRRVEVSEMVRAEMGRALFRADNLPPVGLFSMPSGGREYVFTAVSVANPHAVCFVEDFGFDLLAVAGDLQTAGFFPDGVNVEFAIPKERGAEVRVVERGSGETLSCGSGACAVAAAMVKYELAPKGKVELGFRGGMLDVYIGDDYSAELEGDAVLVCRGEYYEP